MSEINEIDIWANYQKDTDACPFCHTKNKMVADDFDEVCKDCFSRLVTCRHCGRQFRETYGLQYIELI